MTNRFVFIFLTLYFWIGALWQGYFAETAFLLSNMCLFAGLIVALYLRRELILSITHLFILLFVAGYWVAISYAADVEQAVLEAGRVSGLLPLSLIIMMIQDEERTRLFRIWPWIGAFLTIAGIGFGMERNGRLESTLEYANVLAIFLLINILVCLFAYIQERRIAHIALLTVNAVGLLLTFSRSVWVLWLVMMCVALIWFAELRRRRALIAIGFAHLCSIGIALLIKGDGFFFWQRIQSIQSKTSELQIRLVYWQDSFGMIRDYWWGGTGGGGWSVLVNLYRSQNYFVRYVHNHFVQVMLDIGIFGLLVFMAWLGIFCWTAAKQLGAAKNSAPLWIKGTVLLVAAVMLHAGFDFDLSFPFLFGALVCLTVPFGGKTYLWRVPRRTFGIIVPISILAVFLWAWLAVGYGEYRAANSYVKAGRYAEAQEMFAKAELLLPWSSSVLYGSAKGYVHQGNATGESVYYRSAEEKLRRAHEMAPNQPLYIELLNQLRTVSTKND